MIKLTIVAAAAAALVVPVIASLGIESGLKPGEMVTPFHPKHISGPDAGTDTCPPCKYGSRPAVQIWFNGDSEANMTGTAKLLSKYVKENSAKEFKAFMINLTMCEGCVNATKGVADKAKVDNIGITHLPNDSNFVKNYKINTDKSVKNTVLVYKDKKVVGNMVNFDATNQKQTAQLHALIAKATN